jgi:hypothetical protein
MSFAIEGARSVGVIVFPARIFIDGRWQIWETVPKPPDPRTLSFVKIVLPSTDGSNDQLRLVSTWTVWTTSRGEEITEAR